MRRLPFAALALVAQTCATPAYAAPCDSTATHPIAAVPRQSPSVVLLATSTAANARVYVADTITRRCLGYVGATGSPRRYAGYAAKVAYTRTTDSVRTARVDALAALLARAGALAPPPPPSPDPVVVVPVVVPVAVPVPVVPPPVAPPLPPVGLPTVALTVQRFDVGSGPVRVSSGIPLTKGLVFDADVAQLHLFIGGTERRVALKPLAGRFPDGSRRAVLIQFADTFSAPHAAQLVVGGALAARDSLTAPSSTPTAAALPTDPAYLTATRWGGLLTVASADTGLAAQLDADYVRLEAADWLRDTAAAKKGDCAGVRWSCSRTAGYDRAYIAYQAWLRTGDPILWYHATVVAADYVARYVVPNGGPTPWWSQTEGVALHYWATGDETSRYQLRKMAEMLAWQGRSGFQYTPGGTYGDDRMRAKLLTAALDARMLDVPTQPSDAPRYYSNQGAAPATYARYLTPDTLASWVAGVLATQRSDGQFGGRQYSAGTWSPDSGGQSNYMSAMLLSALIRYHDDVSPDPRIPLAVRRWVDDAWAHEWDGKTLGFQYHSLRGTDEWTPAKAATATALAVPAAGLTPARPSPQPGLNAFMAYPFAWLIQFDPSYRPKLDQILTGLASPVSRNWWPSSGKAFDEGFYRLFNTLALRR